MKENNDILNIDVTLELQCFKNDDGDYTVIPKTGMIFIADEDEIEDKYIHFLEECISFYKNNKNKIDGNQS